MKTISIAIVDSGINCSHEALKNDSLHGYSIIVDSEGTIIVGKDFSDTNGHGTAVYYLIKKFTDDIWSKVNITSIKIFHDGENVLNQEAFERILEYITEGEKYDIIHFSLGVIQCDNVFKMQSCINELYNKGTVVVAAFDNGGAMSFPAALENVIGVDSFGGEKTFEIVGIENSPINIVVDESNYKVAWTSPPYCIVKGSSFSCCRITARIAKLLVNNGDFDFPSLCDRIECKAKPTSFSVPYKIGRFAVFPISKENQSIIMFEEMTCGRLVHCYSAKYSGQVGRTINDCFPYINNNRTIENIDSINWDDIDTLVLGHLDKLSSICSRNYKEDLINEAIKRRKNVYCFDKVSESVHQNNNNIYFPHIDSSYIQFRRNRLYKTNKPIVCVSGTSSSQGKFTLQLLIRKKLKEAGYRIGQIGTEPSSFLFGFDECFPCGYNSSVDLSLTETLEAVNQTIWNISQKNIDLIVAGTQSGILPFDTSNALFFPLKHQVFYEALQPDCTVLCINTYDSMDYIVRSIKAAESLSVGKVVGLVCYPIDVDPSWRGLFGSRMRISYEKEIELKRTIENKTGLKVYMIDKEDEIVELINSVLYYLKK